MLDYNARGVRYYCAWKTLLYKPAQSGGEYDPKSRSYVYPHFRRNPVCSGPRAPLTYNGIKLYPIMNDRERRLFLDSHKGVNHLLDGWSLFDPKAQILILRILSEPISR